MVAPVKTRKSNRKDSKTAKAVRSAKGGKKTDGKKDALCKCGCGGHCTKDFKQGHDARYHGRMKKLEAGTLKHSELAGLGVKDYAMKFYKAGAA